MILLQSLLKAVTTDEARTKLIEIATALGFNATSWQSGSPQRTMIEIDAECYAAASFGVADIASGGYNDLAEGTWLHLLADSHYDNQVHDAVATEGTVVMANTSGIDYTIAAYDNVIFRSSHNGATFRNITGGTLLDGGTLAVTVRADVPGAAGNVPVGTVQELTSPLPGVTANNPAISGSDTWITLDGADVESDVQLRQRNRSKWATLGIGAGMSYEYHARAATPSVKRVKLDDTNPRGTGTLDLYLASDSGPVSGSVVTVVDDYLRGVTDGIDRVATTADLLVLPAVANAFSLVISIYILKNYDTTANRDAIENASTGLVATYFKELPIGGTPLSEGGAGAVRISALVGSIVGKISGVQNVTTSLSGDYALAFNAVAVPTVAYTYYPI